MTTIAVPAWLRAEPEPEVQPEAASVLADVRAAAASTSDVASWARAHGAPADFAGSAAEAAQHAATRFAGDTDAVTAALEKGGLAIDRFLTAMARRRSEHADLVGRRTSLNSDRQSLLDRIERAAGADVAALQTEAATLRGRFEAYDDDVEAWLRRVLSDEDAAIAALQGVDTVAEGDRAADDPGRADTAALAAQLQRLGTDTDAVNTWWKGLSESERNALLVSDPDLVGNTNGIPTADRDQGNRAAVQRDIEHLEALEDSGQELSAADRRWLEHARAIEDAVALAGRHPYDKLGVEAYVIAYQPRAFGGDGIAAVSYGDPDSAEHTAVHVPGIMQDGSCIDENAEDALALYEAARNHSSSVAAMAWIGYDSPGFDPFAMPWGVPGSVLDAGHAVTEANAELGGHLLSHFVDGLDSTHRSGNQPHLTVVGHSYGSTTSAHAAADGMTADSLVLIGSPGAGGGVDHVSGLGMPEGEVYVGAKDDDPVTWLGGRDGLLPWTTRDDGLGLGEDPAQSDFGAHVFAVEPGLEPEGPAGLLGSGLLDNHVSYFEDTTALENMAQIVTGNGDHVGDTGGRTQDAHDHLYDWGRGELMETYDRVDDVVDGGRAAWDDFWRHPWP